MKRGIVYLVVTLFFLFTPSHAMAGLVVVEKNGDITWNVLSYTSEATLEIPKNDSLKIKKIASNIDSSSDTTISLSKVGEKVNLSVNNEGEETTLDVTNFGNELVEIEQRGVVQRATLLVRDGNFLIEQKDVTAVTSFPLTVDPASAALSVRTDSGLRLVSILPQEIYENLLRANIFDKLVSESDFRLIERETGELEYEISAEKIINLLRIYEFSVPLTTSVSVSTGEVVSIDQPVWLPLLSIFF